MIKTVFFDMNETLLDLSSLQKQFDKHFDDKYVLKYWFTKLLHTSTVMGIVGQYKDFSELAGVTLESVFHENDKVLDTKVKSEILNEFKKLPAHEDALPALGMLKSVGIRTVAVSNSSSVMIKQQLDNSGISYLIDAYYSVDEVKKYKPFSDIYLSATQQEGVAAENILMVAAHDWDLLGAKKAGLLTAYVQRKEKIYHPDYLQPDYTVSCLPDLAQQLMPG